MWCDLLLLVLWVLVLGLRLICWVMVWVCYECFLVLVLLGCYILHCDLLCLGGLFVLNVCVLLFVDGCLCVAFDFVVRFKVSVLGGGLGIWVARVVWFGCLRFGLLRLGMLFVC